MHSPVDLLEELLAAIAKTLVDHPEEVQVRAVQGQAVSILELRVHPEDVGMVIGSPPYDFRCGWHEAAQARYGGNPRVKLEHRFAGLSRFCRLTTARKTFFCPTLPHLPMAGGNVKITWTLFEFPPITSTRVLFPNIPVEFREPISLSIAPRHHCSWDWP